MKNEQILKAISFAARAHKGQIRKDGATPYVSHCFRVCFILRDVFGVTDEETLIAAVLHDTIEDTTTDFDDLEKKFGNKVASWVSLLSKDKRKQENERERDYFRTLENAPNEVKLIKLADILDNLLDARGVFAGDELFKLLRKADRRLKCFMSTDNEKVDWAVDIVAGHIHELNETTLPKDPEERKKVVQDRMIEALIENSSKIPGD